MNLMMYGWKGISWVFEFQEIQTAILVGIFTVNLGDGWTDGTDDGHTDRWMEVESCLS